MCRSCSCSYVFHFMPIWLATFISGYVLHGARGLREPHLNFFFPVINSNVSGREFRLSVGGDPLYRQSLPRLTPRAFLRDSRKSCLCSSAPLCHTSGHSSFTELFIPDVFLNFFPCVGFFFPTLNILYLLIHF